MIVTRPLPDLAATEALGAVLAASLRPGDAVLLEGPLGAGKTALARALIRHACRDPGLEVPSPSYTLSQDYESPMGTITHFDLWRVTGPDALEELGWTEARDGIVLVEWPDRLGALRPQDALTVRLAPAEDPTGDRGHESGDEDEARLATLSGWPGARLAAFAA